jgi:WbqC-like protein family
MGKTIAIVQSNYIPWKGYFDLMRQVDEFVLYDDVQYTRRDWRNRNRIKTPSGVKWLTIPVEVKGKYFQKIKETRIADPAWGRVHWDTIVKNYGRAPYFREYRDRFESLYLSSSPQYLSDINRKWLECVCELLGIRTSLVWSIDYSPTAVDPTGRLVEICLKAEASTYVSGPAAKAYLDEAQFERAGVRVRFMEYDGYPAYPQLYPPFEHGVSVLDLLLMVGPRAPEYLERVRHAA